MTYNLLKELRKREITGKTPKGLKSIAKLPEFTPLPVSAARQVVNWDDEIEDMIRRFEQRTGYSRHG